MLRKVLGMLAALVLVVFIAKYFLSGEEMNEGNPIAVSELAKNIQTYNDKIVVVEGEVSHSGQLGAGFYTLDDNSGSTIAVMTLRAVPSKGQHVKVRGQVKQMLKVGSQQGLTLIEKGNGEKAQ